MAEAFVRRGERFTGVLEAVELEVVAGLLRQTRELVAPPPLPRTDDPLEALLRECGLEGDAASHEDASALADRDPALDRLVPPAHKEDEAAAAEYRRFTERSIREGKARRLAEAADVLGRLVPGRCELTEAEVTTLSVALTDVRLVLGERMGLRADEDLDRLEAAAEARDPSDALVVLLGYYEFLTWLQDVLVTALMGADD